MTNEVEYTTPCELLAEKIALRLVSEGLIPVKFKSEVINILASSDSKAEDWQLLIEKTLEIEKKEGVDDKKEETN